MTEELGYRYDDDYKRTVATLAENCDVIIAHAIRGTPSRTIAALFGVSRECIDRRLRVAGFKNAPGVRGRPSRQTTGASQPTPPAGAPAWN